MTFIWTMMMTDPIPILFVSDLHFGILSINQEEMADAFAQTVFPLLEDTDILFINGDFFDTLVLFDGHGFDPIYDTIRDLFTLCERHQVILRVLQGTWSHDRNQNKRFGTFYRNRGYTFDFRFAEAIELEQITVGSRYLRIMYVPDDLPFTSSDAIVDVICEKMVEANWDYVDYGCMHGFFDFTCGNMPQKNTVIFKESQFPFVKKMIDVGHVHQHRVSGKVISNGSFDRLCFGDEDPKGLIRVSDYPDHYTAQFIQNKHAAIFDTLYFTKDDTTETIRDKITRHIASISTNRKMYLRFEIETLEHRDAIKAWMKEVYPDVGIKVKLSTEKDDKSQALSSSVLFTPVEKRIAPTPKTIASFVRVHIPDDYLISIDDIDRYLNTPVDKR